MATTMAPVIITYQKPGTKPPIYVAGTFSDPAWQLEEMEYDLDADGEHVFKKEVQGEPGSKIHYKFRIGDGDWWVLNDDTPTVTDKAGNRNNELEVPSPQGTSEHEETEDGHAVVTKATGPGEGGLQPTIDVTGDLQNLSYPHSGADTPTLAMNAAEVADSAALLDEEEAEAEISNEEAGRIGFRRLSSTPIIEVADIAAEVADSAQGLDNTPEVILDDQPQGGYDFRDDDGIDSPPLFAHECVGMQNADEVLHQENQPDEDDHVQNQPAEDVDLDNIDLNDPTLERFPSNREGIINTVRRLESSLDEDRASFEGAPISPVVGAYRPGMEDITGDPFMSSPIVASPIIPRSSRHLEVPRSPRGSISSNHSSPLSLHAIDEGDEPGTTEEDSAAPILLSPPQPRPGFRVPKRSGSDEDEGIAMKDSCSETSKHEHSQSGSKKAGSSRDVISRALQEESPDIEASSRQPEPHHSLTTPESSPDRHNKRRSPEIVVESVEDNQGHDAGMIQQQDGLAGPRTPDSSIGTGLDVGTSTAIEESESFRARKRNNITGHSGATPSNNSVSLHPNREGGWFKSFFRVLFVDWIGGFITRLCGRRRQTLLTAGAAAVFMGISWWKVYGDGPRKPHGN